jgi:hypothetical protein
VERGEIAAYLNDGFAPISTWRAGRWRMWCATWPTSTPEDRLAIAAYIKALPPAE